MHGVGGGGATAKEFAPTPWSPGEGSKGQISFNFNYKVNFKDFYTKLCVCLTNKIYKTYQMGFLFCRLGHAPGVGLWGAGSWGCPGGQKFIFFKHGHVTYQIDRNDKQNRSRTECK